MKYAKDATSSKKGCGRKATLAFAASKILTAKEHNEVVNAFCEYVKDRVIKLMKGSHIEISKSKTVPVFELYPIYNGMPLDNIFISNYKSIMDDTDFTCMLNELSVRYKETVKNIEINYRDKANDEMYKEELEAVSNISLKRFSRMAETLYKNTSIFKVLSELGAVYTVNSCVANKLEIPVLYVNEGWEDILIDNNLMIEPTSEVDFVDLINKSAENGQKPLYEEHPLLLYSVPVIDEDEEWDASMFPKEAWTS